MLDNNQQIISGFMAAVLAATKQIKYNQQFMDHRLRIEKSEINFMNIISHPVIRIVLKPGELAVTRSEHPNPKYARSTNAVLMRGTQYGTLVIFGRETDYRLSEKTGKHSGPLPHLHMPRTFMAAAIRYHSRKNIPFNLVQGEVQLLQWIFSDNFTTDLAEQAKADKEAGIELGDGMVPKKPYKPKPNPAAVAAKGKPQSKGKPSPKAKTKPYPPSVTKSEKHPLDILPCRANGFKGTPYSQQTAEQKAVGEAALTPELHAGLVKEGAGITAEANGAQPIVPASAPVPYAKETPVGEVLHQPV